MNRDFWDGKRVLITGSRGFLGSHLGRALNALGVLWGEPVGDYCVPATSLNTFAGADVIFHLAAKVGGIGYNRSHPADIMLNNLLCDTNVVRAAAHHSVGKLICVGSTCAYPANAPVPIREESFWQGEPEPTNAAYAHGKRVLLANLLAHHAQYGLNFAYLVLANLYGEGQSDDAENSHVIPSLIRKVLDTSTPTISAWGTGNAVREFLHVSDAVNALILAAERVTPPEPINIGSGSDISIGGLLYLIQHYCGDTRGIIWDFTQPDGNSNRLLDWRKANMILQYEPKIGVAAGVDSIIQRRMQPA